MKEYDSKTRTITSKSKESSTQAQSITDEDRRKLATMRDDANSIDSYLEQHNLDDNLSPTPSQSERVQTGMTSFIGPGYYKDLDMHLEDLTATLQKLPKVENAQSQTEGLSFRELEGLDKALQRTHGELTNNLAKLTDLDKDIAKERRKLDEAEDEISKKNIKARLKNLEDERGARLEAATANKEALRSQINHVILHTLLLLSDKKIQDEIVLFWFN